MDTPWYIQLLGGLQARLADRTLSRFQTRQTALLLAFLALHPRRPQPRDALADLLWPHADPPSTRNRLKVALTSLRHQLEPPGVPPGAVLIATRATLQLNPAAATSDVARFEAALQAAARAKSDAERAERLREGVALYQGELLAGYEEAWVLPERERLAAALLGALGELARLAERSGERGEALRWARQAVGADPMREEGQRELIRLLLAAGERETARRQYEAFARRLAAELGAEPEPATRALVGDAPRKTRTVADGPGAAPPSSPPLPAVAARPPAPEPPAPQAAPAGGAAAGEMPRLPLQFTRFFGRESELQLLGKLLLSEQGRLVTVMGPGGSGKTRLAVEAAGRLAGEWGGRVWFVSLAEVAEAARLPEAFREGMGLPPSPHLPALEQVAGVLDSGPALLLLDNVEHLLPEGAGLLERLRERLPGLTCLVTSRRRLGLEGERVLMLAPLPVPEGDERRTTNDQRPTTDTSDVSLVVGRSSLDEAARLLQYPSVALFVDRAQGVRPDFQVTERNAAAVAALCRRLEGVPLSLELAAARAGGLTPRQMVEQLGAGVAHSSLLTRRGRGAEGRHASLGRALEWSYRLLEEPVQRFFARLSAFRGGWRWEAAAAVCEEERALEYLEELGACSLVEAEESGEGMRFRMLETVREFGAEQLTTEEGEALERRHAAHFLALAEAAEPRLTGPEQDLWLDRLEQEHDNLRAALRWAREQGESVAGLRLAVAIGRFWEVRGHWTEGHDGLVALLASGAASELPEVRAKALITAGTLALLLGDYEATRALQEESLAISEATGNLAGVAAALASLGRLAVVHADFDAARLSLERSLAIRRALGDRWGEACSLAYLGDWASHYGDYKAARGFWEESLAIWRSIGDRQWSAPTLGALGRLRVEQGEYETGRAILKENLAIHRELGNRINVLEALEDLGILAYYQGDFGEAWSLLQEALAIKRQLGARQRIAGSLYLLAKVIYQQGDAGRARSLLEESARIHRELGDRRGIAWCLTVLASLTARDGNYAKSRALLAESLTLWQELEIVQGLAQWLEVAAKVAAGEGQPERAARLLGAADALLATTGARRHAKAHRANYERRVAAARAALGESTFAAAWAAGRALSAEEAVAEALQGFSDPS